MSTTRSEALTNLLNDLEVFELNVNQYWGDPEPMGFYDSILGGKLDALARYCQVLGHADLATQLDELLPLNGGAPMALERVKEFVIPEMRRVLETQDVDEVTDPTDWYWDFVHPRIKALAKPRFEAGFFGDAVESSFKEVNDSVKRIFTEITGNEADGSGLMTTAFSPNPSLTCSPAFGGFIGCHWPPSG